MGKPKSKEPRNQQFNLSLTLRELTEIKRRAHALGLRPVHFGRNALLEKLGLADTPSHAHVPDPTARLIHHQLSRLGNNLNQLVRHLHQTGDPMPPDLEPLLHDIRNLISRVAE
ncbi:plasmid mobilization protein [Bradyrhizobium sp. 930_D9_N1_4]|uniref:plasmid mobilization protein n=1 Tax=Bradyrhizobium sp. 930_D9_N1_4 TaxID=3240374 RepID=UPI003F89C82E